MHDVTLISIKNHNLLNWHKVITNTILYTADALISGLIAVGVLFLFCMCCFYFILPITMCLSCHWRSQTATRVETTTRGTVVSVADLRTTSSTQQQPTSSTISPGDTSQIRDQTDETTFTDGQFNSGVAPPSYNTASDYKTLEI